MSNKPIRLIVYFIGAFTLLALIVTATQAKYISSLGGASVNGSSGVETPTMQTLVTLIPSFTPEFTATPEAPQAPQNTQSKVDFSGVISVINGDQWTIGSHTVTVNGKTEIEGSPMVGDMVEVEATLQADGTYLAHDISVENGNKQQPSITPGKENDDDQGENDNEDENHASIAGTPSPHGDDQGEHHVNAAPSSSGDHEGDGEHHSGGQNNPGPGGDD